MIASKRLALSVKTCPVHLEVPGDTREWAHSPVVSDLMMEHTRYVLLDLLRVGETYSITPEGDLGVVLTTKCVKKKDFFST